MSAPIRQDELNRGSQKICTALGNDCVEVDVPALQAALGAADVAHSQNTNSKINPDNVLATDPHARMRNDLGSAEYRGVRTTAIVGAVAVIAWTAVCVVLALSRLDTSNFIYLRNGLAFANDNLGERLHAANAALHKVSMQVLSPTLTAWETTGAVDAELPLAITVTNYTPNTAINLSGLVAGTTVSTGTDAGDGQWRIAIDDLPNTRIIAPRGYVGPMTIFVELRNDDDRAIVRVPLRLTWRRAVTEATGTVDSPDPLPLAPDSAAGDAPKEAVPETATQRDVTATVPPPESRAVDLPAAKSGKSQKLAKKRRHKTALSEPHQAEVDPPFLPFPFFGNILADDQAAHERKPVWNNHSSDIISGSWDRCRDQYDCGRDPRR